MNMNLVDDTNAQFDDAEAQLKDLREKELAAVEAKQKFADKVGDATESKPTDDDNKDYSIKSIFE